METQTQMSCNNFLNGSQPKNRYFIPRTDVFERQDALVIVADMPGVDETSVEVKVERRELSIVGKIAQDEDKTLSLYRREYEEGDFRKIISLTEDFNTEAIDASIKNGVLTILLPKSEKQKLRKITVKAQ